MNDKRVVCTATIEAVKDGEDTIVYQAQIDDQTLIECNNFQSHGVTSKAKVGSNAIVVMPNGSDRIGFVIATESTEYEIALEDGEMAIHSSAENYIKMKADGTIEIVTKTVDIKSDDIKLNGSSKNLVTHAELDTALQKQNTELLAHTHISSAPGAPSAPPIAGTINIDISSSKSNYITTS